MTVKMRAMANRTDLMRAILFGAPPVTLAIFKLANCCFCCSRADLSSVLDCDRRSDVFTWDPVVEIQKGENCGVSTKELFYYATKEKEISNTNGAKEIPDRLNRNRYTSII